MEPWLVVRSPYSLGTSLFPLEQGLKQAAAWGWRQVALADEATLAGAVYFQRAAERHGLEARIGVTRVLGWRGLSVTARLFALDEEGYRWLCRWGLGEMDHVPGSAHVAVLWRGGSPGDARFIQQEWEARGFGMVAREVHDAREIPAGPWVGALEVRCLTEAQHVSAQVLARLSGKPVESTPHPLRPRDDVARRLGHGGVPAMVFPPAGPVLPDGSPKLPRFAEDEQARLEVLVRQGLQRRYPQGGDPALKERVHRELAVIRQLRMAGYFLLVADVAERARALGVRLGPGRGSAVGSVVVYALGITQLDPMRYGLIFERFLTAERQGFPDIDLDFDYERRTEILQYLCERWGADRVAHIGAYGTYGARAVLRDLGRLAGVSEDALKRALGTLPEELKPELSRAREELAPLMATWPGAVPWYQVARELEGVPRHASVHAAGVVMPPGTLVDYLPVREEVGDHGMRVTEYDMASVEALGLVKLDILGLRTLSVVSDVVRQIEVGDTDPVPEMAGVDPADPRTLSLLSSARTESVFQLDGRGVRELLRRMRPRHLDEIIAVVALYRPGPMEMIPTYLERRSRGFQPDPSDPVSAICHDTFGIMLYQEQLMRVVHDLGGYSWEETDRFRKAVSKKDHAFLSREASRFQTRMTEQGYPAETSTRVWSQIAAFGDYGFNKAHAAGYGLLSYYMAYLKAHHPGAFWCAEMSSLNDQKKLADAVRAAVLSGIAVRRPHVNRSTIRFATEGDAILAPLPVIRGIGPGVAEAVIQERVARGPFRDGQDVSRRLLPRLGNPAMRALWAAGALDGIDDGLSLGTDAAQLDLFGKSDSQIPKVPGPEHWYGFPWPESTGPLWLRLSPEADRHAVLAALHAVAAAFPGPVEWALVIGGGKGRRLPDVPRVSISRRLFEAVEDIPGVMGVAPTLKPA